MQIQAGTRAKAVKCRNTNTNWRNRRKEPEEVGGLAFVGVSDRAAWQIGEDRPGKGKQSSDGRKDKRPTVLAYCLSKGRGGATVVSQETSV